MSRQSSRVSTVAVLMGASDKVARFVEVFDDYHERIATAHLNREHALGRASHPIEWAPELVAETTNGNGHVAPEEELEGVGAASDASAAGEWGLPQA